jgi:formylglycine-generating enzyme required for sulfatase activity
MEGPHGVTLAWIPPGSFVMGSSASEPCRDPDEAPHHVTLTRGFWMSAHPITRRQWWKVMRSMPADEPADEHPIEGVSWEEANEFLDVLVEQMEYEFAFRLPSEAEWEYACRAGTVTPYPHGFRLSSAQANFDATRYDERLSAPPLERRQGTTPVGTFPPNAWGLYDVCGNVMEWCADWYGPYDLGEARDPAGPQQGQSRVLRGGGWWSPAHACRSARRSAALPEATALPAGFRVVLVERG